MATKLSDLLTEARKAKKLSKAALGMAQAYGDGWSDHAYPMYVPQVVPDAMEKLMRDTDVRNKLRGMVDRNLNWRSDVWTSPAEWTEDAKLFVPSYNNFEAAGVGKWLSKFPGIQVQAAREGSVALYVKGDGETLESMSQQAEDQAAVDEVSFEAEGGGSTKLGKPYEQGDVLRLWWD